MTKQHQCGRCVGVEVISASRLEVLLAKEKYCDTHRRALRGDFGAHTEYGDAQVAVRTLAPLPPKAYQ